jgi:hypothetical protein
MYQQNTEAMKALKSMSFALLAAGMFMASCSKTDTMEPSGNTADGMRVTQTWHNGNVDGMMGAYLDGTMKHYAYRMYSHQASAGMLQQGIDNVIYRYANVEMSHGQPELAPVLSTMPMGNGLYREMTIVFNHDAQPQQFFKAAAIDEAVAAHTITLVPTNNVFRITDGAIHTGTVR